MAVDFIGDGLALRSKGDIVSSDSSYPIAIPVGTDTQILVARSSTSSGINWESRVLGTQQSFVQLATTTTQSNLSSMRIQSIPQTYNDLLLIGISKHSSTAGGTLAIVFNAQTLGVGTNNVSTYALAGQGITSSSDLSISIANAMNNNNYIANLPQAPNADGSTWGLHFIKILNYSTSYPTFSYYSGHSMSFSVANSTGKRIRIGSGHTYGGSSAISEIELNGVQNSNSQWYLYGIRSL